MELDKDFPKLIVLNDKQGNIFLVNADYTCIPSTCERCGNLGHKAKRCLLSTKALHDPKMFSTKDGISDEIHVVNIDAIMQKENDLPALAFPQKNPMANDTFRTSTIVSEAPLQVPDAVSGSETTPTLQLLF